MKKTVDMKVMIKWSKYSPDVFFEAMPYILDKYNFVTTPNFNFALYHLSHRLRGNYQKIHYIIENHRPNMDSCDWAFSYDYDRDINHPHHLRMPNYVRLGAGKNLIKGERYNAQRILRKKKKFCAYIYSHNVPTRNKFFTALSRYKHIDSPGKCCKNMPTITETLRNRGFYTPRKYIEKLGFLHPYKFCIAFENVSSPGYTCEKIYHAMLAKCIPIYWGNPLVCRDFNPKSFINAHDGDWKTEKQMFEYLIWRIQQIDRNPDLYYKMLREPWYHDNKLSKYVDPEIIGKRFDLIFNSV
jgi:hypothetical protein